MKKLLNLSFYFFLIFENFELQGMKLRILYGRQTNKTFLQVFLETVTVKSLELFVSDHIQFHHLIPNKINAFSALVPTNYFLL